MQPVLSLAERSVESTSITLNNLQAQLQELDHTVDDLREKIVFVNMAFKNKSQLIDDSRKKGQAYLHSWRRSTLILSVS